ncbi:MAG: NCS2 family permease [Anaeroplasma sp.]
MENQTTKEVSAIDKFFGVTSSGSSVKKEIIAGIITFLAMAYILTVNPTNILFAFGGNIPSSTVTWASVFMATAFGAVIGTLLMALFAKMPLAQAPGMGLNFTVGTILLGAVGGILFSFGQAMLLVLISGIIFLLLSVVPCKKDKETGRLIALRELIFDGMPEVIRKSITVGIGLFIAFIGLKNASVIVDNPGTFVSLVSFNTAEAWANGGPACQAIVCIFGLFLIGILSHYNVKGSIIIGIIAATILAIPLGVADVGIIAGEGSTQWAFWNNFANFFKFGDESAFFSVFTSGFKGWNGGMIATAVVLVITFCMIDMFDTMGTVVGCTTAAGLVDENGKPVNYNKIMISDSVATAAGALLGTSTVTTFVESASGIAAGGKTGLTSLVTAALFFLSMFIAPVFEFIPSAACAPALVYVGVLMMQNVVGIDFKNIKNAIPAFVTIIMMPLTYSITNGIGLGIITYVVIYGIIYCIDLIKYKKGKIEEKPNANISIVLLVVFALFLLYFLLPTAF